MYVHHVAGTISYTTSTTNMYKDRFHVRVAVVGGRGYIACCRERQRHGGTRVDVFQLFLNAAFNGGGVAITMVQNQRNTMVVKKGQKLIGAK